MVMITLYARQKKRHREKKRNHCPCLRQLRVLLDKIAERTILGQSLQCSRIQGKILENHEICYLVDILPLVVLYHDFTNLGTILLHLKCRCWTRWPSSYLHWWNIIFLHLYDTGLCIHLTNIYWVPNNINTWLWRQDK